MTDGPDATRTNHGAAKHLTEGRVLADRFRLGEILGAGGMGVVYAAWDEHLDQPVAIKLLRSEVSSPDLAERFRREIVLARKVSHPHVVRIHDVFRDGDLPFLTMDLVRGRSLREVLRSDGPLATPRAVRIVRQLAEALRAAHAEGVLHRDLKPENVLVEGEEGEERVRITDFGIARSLGEATALTASGAVIGTLDYLSPEQAAGDSLDARSDLYALGLIFHELLAGSLPFRRGTPSEMLAQRIGSSPSLARLDDAPERWTRVISRLTQRDPGRRYPDADGLLRDLDDTGPTAPMDPVPRGPRNAFAIGLASLLLATGAATWWQSTRDSEAAPAANEQAIETTETPTEMAVLPFADRTGDTELSWVARGGAEILSDALASRPDLRVVDPFRVFRLLEDLGLDHNALTRAQQKDLATLLDVDRLVTGTVRKEGRDLRLEIALTRPGEPPNEEPPRSTTEISAVDAIGTALYRVAARLGPDPDRGVAPMMVAEIDESVSPAARAAYDRGVASLVRGDPLDAVDALTAATDESPGFVAAWIRASDAELALGRPQAAKAAIRRAVDIAAGSTGRRPLEIAARVAQLRGDLDDAVSQWQRLVQAYPRDSEARLRLAEAVGARGDLSEARRILREVVKVDSKHPRAWYLLSKFAIQAGDLEEAVDETLVHALVIQNQLDNDTGRADVLNAMGVAYDRLGRSDLARLRYAEAADLRREIGDARGLAASLRNLGALAAVSGDHATAERRFDEAAEVMAELGDRRGLASLANRRGLLAEERGEVRLALDLHRKALQIRRDLGDGQALAENYNHVGYAYFLLGDFDNARVYWDQALDEVEERGNRQGEVFVRQSLGLLALARGRWDEATSIFLDSLELGRELDIPDVRAVAHGYLGRLAQLQGRIAASLESNARALEILEDLGDPRGIGEFSLLRAETLLDIGSLDDAASAAAQARSALEAVGNENQLARLDVLDARHALAAGDLEAADRSVESAERRAADSDALEATWESGWARALRTTAAGEPGRAALRFRELEERAQRVGHAVYHLRAAGDLGRAELAARRPSEAAEAFQRGLALLPADEELAERFRLLVGLATAQKALGDEAGSGRTLARAREEVQRVRDAVPPSRLKAFDELTEVQALGN